jgi:predicted ATPase
MIAKLKRLPAETQNALQHLACLGNTAQVAMLSIVLGTAEEQMHAALWAAVRMELVDRLNSSYKFLHDRVREAMYSLIPEDTRVATHLRIGRPLVAQTPAEKQDETIFEIVTQLNLGATLINARDERDQLAKLNLTAGKHAKASSAYASALGYFVIGATLLGEYSWERQHEFTFALELNRAECEFLTGALTEAKCRIGVISERARDVVEQATVACLRLDLYMTLAQNGRAIGVGLEYLQHLGVNWSPHPTEEDARCEYDRIWSQIGSRTIEELVDLPAGSVTERWHSCAWLAFASILRRHVIGNAFEDRLAQVGGTGAQCAATAVREKDREERNPQWAVGVLAKYCRS